MWVGERLGFSAQLNMAEKRDQVESSVALGAGMTRISSDSEMEGSVRAIAQNRELAWTPYPRNVSATAILKLPAPADEDVEPGILMDSHLYKQAIQGDLDGFIQILRSISSKKELQHEEILSQVSPGNNTCLHIAVSFGHYELAKYIVGRRSDLIKEQNSQGDTALHIAARKKDLSFVKFVMDSCPSGSAASRDVEKAEHSLLRISKATK